MAAPSFQLERINAPRIDPAPRRIVIRAVNWLGDLVLSLPAMRAIRRAWPHAHIAALVRSELSSFFDGADFIEQVIPFHFASALRGLGDRRRLAAEIRAGSFDLAVIMPNSFESAFWIAAAGVPMRAGFAGDARGPLLTHKATMPRDAREGHQVNQWLALIRETLGISGSASEFTITPHQPHVERMRQWLRDKRRRPGSPMVCVAPTAAYGPAKEWPAAKFASVIDRLAQGIGAECVLVGAPDDRAKCEAVAALTNAGAIVAAGETSVGELIAMLSLSTAFVGNDSGTMHLAAALGTPAAAIFGSTNPDRTGPLSSTTMVFRHPLECSPCLARTCRFGHYNCLKLIDPGEVAAALIHSQAIDWQR